MNIVDKIEESFAYFRTNRKESLTIKQDFFWVVKLKDFQGIAVEIPHSQPVNEKLNSIHYYSKEYDIEGHSRNLLMLVSDNSKHYNEFIIICAGFLGRMEDSRKKEEIQSNPISWWHTMKELIGNANVEKRTYSMLAEMLSYYYLSQKEKKVSWIGPLGGTVDFECDENSYEVKSTVSRYDSQITVNSQHQMLANYLLFFRFEPSKHGVSIEDFVSKLVELGRDERMIEIILEKFNFIKGSEIRKQSYRILEVKKYTIDDNFPKILPSSFIHGQLPDNISSLTYEINLNGLKGENVALSEFGII